MIHAYVVLLLLLIHCVIPTSAAAVVTLQRLLQPSERVTLGPGDALVLVDYWERRKCPIASLEFDALAVKTNALVKRARDNGAQIIYAQGDAKRHYRGNATIVRRTWTQQDRRSAGILPAVRRMAIKVQAQHEPPISLFLDEERERCANRSIPDRRLHRAVQVDAEKDIMFDDGYFFEKIQRLANVTRLFYVGKALNLCVLHTRRYSALAALFSRTQFQSVGIIVDYTLPTIEAHSHCVGHDNAVKCVEDFVVWASSVFSRNQLTFWHTGSLHEMPIGTR